MQQFPKKHRSIELKWLIKQGLWVQGQAEMHDQNRGNADINRSDKFFKEDE